MLNSFCQTLVKHTQVLFCNCGLEDTFGKTAAEVLGLYHCYWLTLELIRDFSQAASLASLNC